EFGAVLRPNPGQEEGQRHDVAARGHSGQDSEKPYAGATHNSCHLPASMQFRVTRKRVSPSRHLLMTQKEKPFHHPTAKTIPHRIISRPAKMITVTNTAHSTCLIKK